MASRFLACFGSTSSPGDKLYNADCLRRIVDDTAFQVCELQALHELFASLCQDKRSFTLSRESCRMSYRFFDMFDRDRDRRLNFDEFARGLAVFHPGTPREVKINFMFEFYDVDHKGFLVRSDVEEFLASALPLGTSKLEMIVEATFAEADTNSDGRIDREEWIAMVNKHERILQPLTLEVLKEITLVFPEFIFHDVDWNLETIASS